MLFPSLPLPQESQQMLGRLIPEKQILSDQLKQVQQNSLHSRCHLFACFVCSVDTNKSQVLEGDFFAEVTFPPVLAHWVVFLPFTGKNSLQ